MIEEIERKTGANYLEEIDRHTRLTDKQEMKIKQMTTDIADVIEDWYRRSIKEWRYFLISMKNMQQNIRLRTDIVQEKKFQLFFDLG